MADTPLFATALGVQKGTKNMAHVEKFTRQQVTGVANHLERKTEYHSNKDIDPTKTHLNYSHLEDGLDLNQRLQNRLSEVSVFNRKDVNVMSSWIVTLPQELKEATQGEIEQFFKSTHDFLEKRYGGLKNVLASEVHMDETTPHLHFAFVPTMFDEKRGMDRVNAKLVVSRSDLKTFHGDLDAYLKQDIPKVYEKGVVNGKTLGLDSVEQIKLHDEIINRANDKARAADVEYKSKKSYVRKIQHLSEVTEKLPSYAKIEKKIFGSQEFVKVPKEKWQERTLSVQEFQALTEARDTFDKKVRDFRRTEYYRNFEKLAEVNQELEAEVNTLKNELNATHSKLRVFDMADRILHIFKEPILKHFDRLHTMAEKIPHENLRDFCTIGLEGILSYQNDLELTDVAELALQGWNNGAEHVREEYGLFQSTREYEIHEMMTYNRENDYDFEI